MNITWQHYARPLVRSCSLYNQTRHSPELWRKTPGLPFSLNTQQIPSSSPSPAMYVENHTFRCHWIHPSSLYFQVFHFLNFFCKSTLPFVCTACRSVMFTSGNISRKETCISSLHVNTYSRMHFPGLTDVCISTELYQHIHHMKEIDQCSWSPITLFIITYWWLV